MAIRLHLNVDHVATVRNARGTPYPDPVTAAGLAELAGVDGITCHLREDRRHIRDEDVRRLRSTVTTLLNLEMAATDEMLRIAIEVRPDVVTLVPERREERTTEGGLDVVGRRAEIGAVVGALKAEGVRVSLFLGPDEASIAAGAELGVDQIELHTGDYAHAAAGPARQNELGRLRRAAASVRGKGVALAAGHGLTRHNVLDVAAIAGLEELNIGHALVADAIFLGLEGAVRAMRAAVDRALIGRGGEP
jgi:pyridoxine 5-phosphate synthase